VTTNETCESNSAKVRPPIKVPSDTALLPSWNLHAADCRQFSLQCIYQLTRLKLSIRVMKWVLKTPDPSGRCPLVGFFHDLNLFPNHYFSSDHSLKMENDFDDAEALWDQLEKRQFWPTVTTNNFGSTTTVTIYGTLVTITAWTGSSTTVYISTEPTATSYSTPTPALTTIFTPPSSCLSEIVWEANTVWQIAPLYETQCYPYGYATSIYYSPGICPSGYMMGEQTLHSIIQGTSTAWETYAACCPRYEYFLSFGCLISRVTRN